MAMISKNPEYGVQDTLPKVAHRFKPGPWARCENRLTDGTYSRVCSDFFKNHDLQLAARLKAIEFMDKFRDRKAELDVADITALLVDWIT